MLVRVCDAVDTIAGALETEPRTAIDSIDLRRVKLLLDTVYAGSKQPAHPTVLEAVADMIFNGLRVHERFVLTQRERCLAALACLVAGNHGIELNLRPLLMVERTLARFRRQRELTVEDIRTWLESRIVSGRPERAITITAPSPDLRGMVGVLGRPVFKSEGAALARDNYLAKALSAAVAGHGGQLLLPTPLSPETEPWRTEVVLRNDAVLRLGRGNIFIALSDDPSSGVGAEIHAAIQLRLPVVFVQTSSKLSSRFDPAQVQVLPYGRTLANAPRALLDWLSANRWLLANAARRREDRDLVTLRERAALLSAWKQRSEAEQHRLAEVLGLSLAWIGVILQSAAALELTSGGSIDDLHTALDVDLPGPQLDAPRYDRTEIEALARVAHERQLTVLEAYQASDALLVELASSGSRRGSLADDTLWHRYFDEVGLDGRN